VSRDGASRSPCPVRVGGLICANGLDVQVQSVLGEPVPPGTSRKSMSKGAPWSRSTRRNCRG
jgi:hypothetical protein